MDTTFNWAVIGAGPTGIACVAQLLDSGVDAKTIAWIDPAFETGDFGTRWRHVNSNTLVKSFVKAYTSFDSFEYNPDDKKYLIDKLDPTKTCPLIIAAQPLHDFTRKFRNNVTNYTDFVTKLSRVDGLWLLSTAGGKKIRCLKTILAIGAEAKTLPFSDIDVIELSTAANPSLLKDTINENDTIAVFGSYQSARTVEKNLVKTSAKCIYHFYHSQREFNRHIGSLNLSDRVIPTRNTPDNLLKIIPLCNKAIYAIGFRRRHIYIEGLPEDYSYEYKTGRIAPGIYGIGIAFPEIIPYSHGRIEYKIAALQPVIKHLKEVFSYWQLEQTQPNTIFEPA